MCVHRSVLIHVQDFGDMQTHQHHAAGDMALFLEGRGGVSKVRSQETQKGLLEGAKEDGD